MSTNVAAVGRQEATQPERWRLVARRILHVFLALAGIALVAAFPPTFDIRPGTIVSVVIVAAFLVFVERSQTAAGSTVAPLTAIMTASAVTFGPWALVIGFVAAVTIQVHRLRVGEITASFAPFLIACQAGAATVSTYAMLATWSGVQYVIARWPVGEWVLLFAGIVAVGIAWQTSFNLMVAFDQKIGGSSFPVLALVRPGLVASLYAYMLVAMYNFGGIFAAALFYVVVAQFNLIEQTLGTSIRLLKLDRAQDQATALARDLSHLLDAETVEFGSEVQNIAQIVARNLGMSRREVAMIGLAAELHEIGKCRLAVRVRTNKGLNQAELAQYLTYPRLGAVMIRSCDALLPREIADWIEFHREHFDGNGGPRGLRGDAIPLASRIIAIARQYVAMLTGYDGVEMTPKETALARLASGGGALYDPELVELLEQRLSLAAKDAGVKRVHEVADAG
ncbi:MAG TPA: HD domain-containing phosphohydrolase [Candidatus Eremiobacteraceae bacterium]|nr:HD domain-containing phosphohydrolase [Candidatus Eremiobacteraceae bacterium]